MKKIHLRKGFTKVALIAMLATTAGAVLAQQAAQAEGVATEEVVKVEGATVVTNFAELKAALKNASVTAIEVADNIEFTGAITGVPMRDIQMYSNPGVTINLNKYYISAAISSKNSATFTLTGADVSVTKRSLGTFFKGCLGWDFVSKDNVFNGETFVQLDKGTLTFEGENSFDTEDEIGWVKNVVFAENSKVTGVASNSVHDRAAFKFKVADGQAIVKNGAVVDLEVKNKLHPVFGGYINKIMVEDNASVKIVAEGPVATMTKSLKGEVAEINAGSKAVVDFQSTSATKQTLTLPKGGSQVNLSRGATFNVVGAAKTGVISSATDTAFNIDRSKSVVIENTNLAAPLFTKTSLKTTVAIDKPSRVRVYDRQGAVQTTWNIKGSSFIVNKGATASVDSSNADFVANLKMQDYSKFELLSATN